MSSPEWMSRRVLRVDGFRALGDLAVFEAGEGECCSGFVSFWGASRGGSSFPAVSTVGAVSERAKG